MNAVALTSRAILLTLLLALVARKAWPTEILNTPLAQLTLGALLIGLAKLVVGIAIVIFLVFRLFSVPDQKERTSKWRDNWIGAALIVALIIPLPFIASSTNNPIVDFMIGVIVAAGSWIIS